jgi:hypothetical protein
MEWFIVVVEHKPVKFCILSSTHYKKNNLFLVPPFQLIQEQQKQIERNVTVFNCDRMELYVPEAGARYHC